MVVPKKDGRVRICGDYKVALDVGQHPLPRPEDLFATLAGGEQFTTLNLSHAYNQLFLENPSRKFLTLTLNMDLSVYCLRQKFFRKLWTQYYRVCRE